MNFHRRRDSSPRLSRSQGCRAVTASILAALEVDDILATDLGAVEVYSGSSLIPAQFSSMAPSACGAIILWTRRGKRPGER